MQGSGRYGRSRGTSYFAAVGCPPEREGTSPIRRHVRAPCRAWWVRAGTGCGCADLTCALAAGSKSVAQIAGLKREDAFGLVSNYVDLSTTALLGESTAPWPR